MAHSTRSEADSASANLAADMRSLFPKFEPSRREAVLTTLATGFALATQPVAAGWFVAEDSANFGVVQLVISVLLVTALVAIATFWSSIIAWLRGWRVPK